jgi:hypothetical protein
MVMRWSRIYRGLRGAAYGDRLIQGEGEGRNSQAGERSLIDFEGGESGQVCPWHEHAVPSETSSIIPFEDNRKEIY